MGPPNAILAINSLDRYITSAPTIVYSNFEASWANGVNTLTLGNVNFGYPIVGATIVATAYGLPQCKITAIILPPGPPSPQVDTIITISTMTTGASGGFQEVLQISEKNNAASPVSVALRALYYNTLTFVARGDPRNNTNPQYCYNFSIQSPNALIQGYISSIIVSQIQLQYNIPTINANLNDSLIIGAVGTFVRLTIPFGFYWPDELAAVVQKLCNDNPTLAPLNIGVTFVPRTGFVFASGSTEFSFPSADVLLAYTQTIPGAYPNDYNNYLKTYRVFGIAFGNDILAKEQVSVDYPNFLYTPYIDIYSDKLTNYQNVKDTNTSISKLKGMVARIYVSGTGQNQTFGSLSAIGSAAFVMTADLNSPKVIRWTPDEAPPSLDFQLYDQYGDFIPGSEFGFNTEFQMTLLCIEGRN